jgi:hypothetical protein
MGFPYLLRLPNAGIFYISLVRITCYGIAWKRMESCGFFTTTWKRFIGRTLWKFLRVSYGLRMIGNQVEDVS